MAKAKEQDTSTLEREIEKELERFNNYASMYAAKKLQTLLIKAYDDMILQFYSSFYPKKYRRHDISYSSDENGRRIPNNEGVNLYRAQDPLNKNVDKGNGSHKGGISLSADDMKDRNYKDSKDHVLNSVLHGYRFLLAEGEAPIILFRVIYDEFEGTPIKILRGLTEKYWQPFLEEGYKEASKKLKTKYVKYE